MFVNLNPSGLFLIAPLKGVPAALAGTTLVVLPTALRESLDDVVVGMTITPYIPFIILAAIVLGWKQTAIVAAVSAVVADALFIGTRARLFEGTTDLIDIGIFAIAAAMIIGLVQSARKVVADLHRSLRVDRSPRGIIFSLDRGDAWASWNGLAPPVCLGPRDEVASMMRDFLAQVELGKRLTREKHEERRLPS